MAVGGVLILSGRQSGYILEVSGAVLLLGVAVWNKIKKSE